MMFLLLLEKPDTYAFILMFVLCITVYFKVAMMSVTEMCGQ